MHISKVDLNLFIVFEAIYAEGSITRASLKMNLTQPAISHALNRLRQLFDDPLFERQGHVMVPTPLARSIIDPVRQSLRGFEVTLNGAERFDAATSGRSFSLALRDVLEASVLPPLMARMAQDAPTVGLNTLQVGRRELESELAAGTLDAAIDVMLPLSNEIRLVNQQFQRQMPTRTPIVRLRSNSTRPIRSDPMRHAPRGGANGAFGSGCAGFGAQSLRACATVTEPVRRVSDGWPVKFEMVSISSRSDGTSSRSTCEKMRAISSATLRRMRSACTKSTADRKRASRNRLGQASGTWAFSWSTRWSSVISSKAAALPRTAPFSD
jgi:DNA-binding transcriptional LysR family regulator